jgi:exonuclease VII large subunit
MSISPAAALPVLRRPLQPAGIGSLQLAFEQMKQRLARILFDESQSAPRYPMRIGIVTSPPRRD